ncbi:MAG: thioredoxin domain-containing protein [Verrucomicrobiota bacterium]
MSKPNQLIHESSPYLQQHAYNPVDWYPWGPAAFAKARAENKPIFLSIGYSTCHWCHVMEHESFENDELAAVLNEHFVSIKVDREERPDLDKIYMTATQATTGSGGWPMSVWLTHDLKPFYCGTYFPPDARYGRPGFKDILLKINDVWEANHDGILAQANQITETIRQHAVVVRDDSERPLDLAPLQLCFEQTRGSYDATNGGFGGAPKFPRPVTLNFLFQFAATAPHPDPLPASGERGSAVVSPLTFRGGEGQGEEAAVRREALDMALFTLRKMGEGGLFDQLGGGFHRYSVDDHWLVSHFEKMLYDQAQLVSSYIEAYQLTHDEFFADIACRTCDYVLREMTSPDGGFYAAEDADSEGVEGKFYVWTHAEIAKVLGDRAEAFCRAYDVTEAGNWEHGVSVLHGTGFAAERAELLAVRAKRVRPHRDDKVLTAWNGLMISALCRAAQAGVARASRPCRSEQNGRDARATDYLAAAQKAARCVYRDGQLMRSGKVPAVLDDYAFFGNALIDLYETDFDPVWLTQATRLTDQMLSAFYDAADGGFFMNAGGDPSVILRAKEEYDGAEPSGNSMAVRLLLRLAEFTERDDYRQAAERTLTLFAPRMRSAPHVMPQMLCALDFALGKTKQIVIAGQPADPLLRVIRQRYLPNKIVLRAGSGWAKDLQPIAGKATAYVCVDHACQLPTTVPDELEKLLE